MNMMEGIALDWVGWITIFDLPAMAGMLTLILRGRAESAREAARLQGMLDRRTEQFREALSAFKLEVAKSYAAQSDLRDLESRLVQHLLRIEAKLDKTALKAAELARKND